MIHLIAHLGQKDRIEIFGRRAAKMSKNSWRETFASTGVKFPSEILSPGENFGNSTHLVALDQKDRIVIFIGRVAKMSKKSWRKTFGFTGVKFRCEILSPGEKFGNLTNLVAPQDRSQVLIALWSKRPNRNFRPWDAQNG